MVERKLIKLSFSVEEIIYKNAETGYGVICGKMANNESVFAVGNLFGVDVGESLNAIGCFVQHRLYGRQFQVESFKQNLPADEVAIRKFLVSGVIKGVGPVLCNRLVDRFGGNTLKVLESSPDEILKVKGFSQVILDNLKNGLNELFAMKRFFIFLEQFGQKPGVVGVKAWRRWGVFALEKIKINPFVLCEEGVDLSFFEADKIATNLHIKKNSIDRIIGALQFVLKHNAVENGHTCAPRKSVVEIVCKLLKLDLNQVEEALNEQIERKQLFCCEFNGKKFLFLPTYFFAEQLISKRVQELSQLHEDILPQTFESLMELEQSQLGLEFSSLQKSAVLQAISNGIFVLTGGPGTGKTTILKVVVSILEQRGLNVAICAPTGRAAKRLFELTGKRATTIHRLLGFLGEQGEFVHCEGNLLKFDVVVVDEMSMVDCLLFSGLLKATKSSCRFVLTGDCNQLPSVSAGNVLKNLLESKLVAKVELNEIFRQAAKSLIVQNAHAVVGGRLPVLDCKSSNFFFINEANPPKIAQLTVDLATKRLIKSFNYDVLNDVQVVCLCKKGVVGTINLNKMIQAIINGQSEKRAQFQFGFYTYREGDKVMQIKNDYEIKWQCGEKSGEGIFNGDIGILRHINNKRQVFSVDFDGKLATYKFSQAREIDLAYAITVHKSQGNEFNCVVLPVVAVKGQFFSRNLFYTAITRAKQHVVVVGTRRSVELMCSQVRVNFRYSGLKWFLN